MKVPSLHKHYVYIICIGVARISTPGGGGKLKQDYKNVNNNYMKKCFNSILGAN